MNTIDLNRVIKDANLKPTHLAKELFPDHKHPYNALNYIRQGRGLLNSWQIAKLSELAKIPIEALFTKA